MSRASQHIVVPRHRSQSSEPHSPKTATGVMITHTHKKPDGIPWRSHESQSAQEALQKYTNRPPRATTTRPGPLISKTMPFAKSGCLHIRNGRTRICLLTLNTEFTREATCLIISKPCLARTSDGANGVLPPSLRRVLSR